MQNYRNLTPEEVGRLKAQLCSCEDWSRIRVTSGFTTDGIQSVCFSGNVTLGSFKKSHRLDGGVSWPSGIRNARIHNCTVGDDVLIANIGNCIANCDIEKEVIILDSHGILTDQRSRFGNDVNAHVLNETGGREVPIYNELSAQIAYILAMYRDRQQLMARLALLIAAYADQRASSRGSIGEGSKIIGCGSLRNVCVGSFARLYGVSSLENGTVNSSEEARCRIGSNVIARDFIFSSGTVISDGAQITRCFVGQASHIGHLFSAHDSLFFSNCQMENGEACAVFAGPYSVSMHKSSLLIAAMYSFLNAGSGFNQSNHMYKLGPIHQGIVERGGRMASDSYILWPARIGPFTMVMGRHTTHLDTSDLPFSYIIQSGTESHITPGANLQRVGTIRDSFKWPARDKRTDRHRLDIINFDLLTPYTIRKIIRAIEILRALKAEQPADTLRYHFQGAIIKKSSLMRGIEFYERAVDLYLGNLILHYLNGHSFSSTEELRALFPERGDAGTGDWVDLAGFIVPQKELDEALAPVEEGTLSDIRELQLSFEKLQESYSRFEWNWSANLLESRFDITLSELNAGQVRTILRKWHEAFLSVNNHLLEDAAKEFRESSRIGFGIDGDESTRLADFEAVRGTYDQQEFVRHIRKEMHEKKDTYEHLLIRLDKLR